jgi:hypothetical protein
MTGKHDPDDRWLAALAGQAEPHDGDTRQAAALRRFFELQGEREAPLERKAAGRMARRLQAGLAAAQPAGAGTASEPTERTRPAAPDDPPPWWSRAWVWCFPPLQGHAARYAGAGALAVAVAAGLVVGPGLWPGNDPALPAGNERVATAEPARPTTAQPARPAEAARTEQIAALSRRATEAATAAARATTEDITRARREAIVRAPGSVADPMAKDAPVPAPAPVAAPAAATATATATAAEPVPVPVPARAAVPVPLPVPVAAAPAAAQAPASTGPRRQVLSVPAPADAAAQLEDLLRQREVAFALRIHPGEWLLDADVPAAGRQALIDPLRKFRLELPDDGKLRVRIVQAR